ncbi:hypothetical protein G7Y79_00079g100450 [Physcia stellaris]|nr:hypothetical protein G7Y79_00079g100450 [Physcia stellaris]
MPIPAAFPTTLALSNEAYELVRNTVKHYTTMARNAITAASPQSSPTSPTKVPPGQQRRMACTHLTMKRQYGEYRCMICRRVPDIGWIYICTQDEAEMTNEEEELDIWNDGAAEADSHWLEKTESGALKPHPRPVTQLSAWIEKAIADGHYTPEQVVILREQKQDVNDKIAAAMQHFRDTEAQAAAQSQPSVDATAHLPFPVINQVSNAQNDDILPSNPAPTARLFPYCEHRACHNCRSTFRDRTWQKFDDIFEDRTAPFIDFETDNRPLASPSIVASLGIHEPKRKRQRPLLHTFDSMGLHRARSGKRALETATSNRPKSDDLADQGEAESKGLRHTVKRAFREMLMSRRDSIASNRSSLYTAKPSRDTSRRSRLHKESPTEESSESDLGVWKQANDTLLREAPHVKLPGHDGHDGLVAETEEVEVEDGVAVTEEGVDTGTADVIMSV